MPHEKETSKEKAYEQPEGLIAGFLWRLWIKTSVTFALSMLETWEIILIFVITGIFALLIMVGLVRFFPYAIRLASRRTNYYLFGLEPLADTIRA